jgi:hypothetical protein
MYVFRVKLLTPKETEFQIFVVAGTLQEALKGAELNYPSGVFTYIERLFNGHEVEFIVGDHRDNAEKNSHQEGVL